MPHAYTEDQLVEQAAIGLFAELGVPGRLPMPALPAGGGFSAVYSWVQTSSMSKRSRNQ